MFSIIHTVNFYSFVVRSWNNKMHYNSTLLWKLCAFKVSPSLRLHIDQNMHILDVLRVYLLLIMYLAVWFAYWRYISGLLLHNKIRNNIYTLLLMCFQCHFHSIHTIDVFDALLNLSLRQTLKLILLCHRVDKLFLKDINTSIKKRCSQFVVLFRTDSKIALNGWQKDGMKGH